jgi:hypothetical protein
MGMVNASGVCRGDRNRNARLARVRELVSLENAIVGIDLADKKQMVVVTDHDSKVLARRSFRCRAWDLGVAMDCAAERAAAKGFAGTPPTAPAHESPPNSLHDPVSRRIKLTAGASPTRH